jgi:hypothetical protein
VCIKYETQGPTLLGVQPKSSKQKFSHGNSKIPLSLIIVYENVNPAVNCGMEMKIAHLTSVCTMYKVVLVEMPKKLISFPLDAVVCSSPSGKFRKFSSRSFGTAFSQLRKSCIHFHAQTIKLGT